VAWFVAGFVARVARSARTLTMGSSVVARRLSGGAGVASFVAGFVATVEKVGQDSNHGFKRRRETFWRGWRGLDGCWIRG
jgi:hypothetical protein